MKGKGLLVAFLLAVGLCLVPGVGHGEVTRSELEKSRKMACESEASFMDIYLLTARIEYMMRNPNHFLNVYLSYHQPEYKTSIHKYLPEHVDTKGKVVVVVRDNDRGMFADKSEEDLLFMFEFHLKNIWYPMSALFPDIHRDIVALFLDGDDMPLGYFYQGEYHLWSGQKQDVSESSRYGKRTYSGLGGGHRIAEKIERGRQIKLEDSSLWKISARHRLKTMLWEVSQKITVVENDDLLYPYRLINQNTGDAVEVELVSE